MKSLKETITSVREIFKGNVIDVRTYTVSLPNGKPSEREVVLHRGAVSIIAIFEGEMYFVRQHRVASDHILLEIPAGKREVNETPMETAIKELKEEIGATCERMECIAEFQVSPGFTNERVNLYLAHDLKLGKPETEHDEFLEIVKIPIGDLPKMLDERAFQDAKTLIAVQYVVMNIL